MPEESVNEHLKRGTRVRLDWSEGPPTFGYVTRRWVRHPTMNCWWYFVREDGESKSVKLQGTGLTLVDENDMEIEPDSDPNPNAGSDISTVAESGNKNLEKSES